jgi:hypothetical protein
MDALKFLDRVFGDEETHKILAPPTPQETAYEAECDEELRELFAQRSDRVSLK